MIQRRVFPQRSAFEMYIEAPEFEVYNTTLQRRSLLCWYKAPHVRVTTELERAKESTPCTPRIDISLIIDFPMPRLCSLRNNGENRKKGRKKKKEASNKEQREKRRYTFSPRRFLNSLHLPSCGSLSLSRCTAPFHLI